MADAVLLHTANETLNFDRYVVWRSLQLNVQDSPGILDVVLCPGCTLVSLAQTLYLPAGGRKGSGNRAYVSFPSSRIVGNNTLACKAYGKE